MHILYAIYSYIRINRAHLHYILYEVFREREFFHLDVKFPIAEKWVAQTSRQHTDKHITAQTHGGDVLMRRCAECNIIHLSINLHSGEKRKYASYFCHIHWSAPGLLMNPGLALRSNLASGVTAQREPTPADIRQQT